jgi:uncharacterized peroxidase-related enzyme
MFIAEPPQSDEVAAAYERDTKSDGYVMNLTRLWAWRDDVQVAFQQLRTKLMSESTLGKREMAVLVCAAASTLRDAYCSIAWGSRLAAQADPATAAAVLKGTDAPALTERERALAEWARKVVARPNGTTVEDVADLKRAGLTDKEILEATVFIAFRVAFSTVNDALGAQPDAKLAGAAPGDVRAAVDFGRRIDA